MEDYKDIKDRIGEALSYEERALLSQKKMAAIARASRPDQTALEVIKMQQASKEKSQPAVTDDGVKLSPQELQSVITYMNETPRRKKDFINIDTEGNESIRWSDGLFYWTSDEIEAVAKEEAFVSDRFLMYVKEVEKL